MSFARFKHWFVNVFWYHYKWATLGTVFALVLLISVLVSIFGQRDPDLGYMMVDSAAFAEDATMDMNTMLTERFGDINGDGVPYFDGQVYDFRTDSALGSEYVIANTTRFAGALSSHAVSLVFFAEGSLDQFTDTISFINLEEHGIHTGTDDPYKIDVTEHPAIQSAGFGKSRVYAAVFAMMKNKDDPTELYEHQTLGLEVLRLLQESL